MFSLEKVDDLRGREREGKATTNSAPYWALDFAVHKSKFNF